MIISTWSVVRRVYRMCMSRTTLNMYGESPPADPDRPDMIKAAATCDCGGTFAELK